MSDREQLVTDTIKISKSVARWLIAYGKQLVDDGYGTNMDPMDPLGGVIEPTTAGFIDEIPMENGEMWRYMNAVINFARTVAAILGRALQEDDLPPIRTLFLEDEV